MEIMIRWGKLDMTFKLDFSAAFNHVYKRIRFNLAHLPRALEFKTTLLL